jgi:hypothetical protein
MNHKQRDQNRRTARLLAQDVFYANLPCGLISRRGKLYFDCEGCERECEWHGTPQDFAAPDAIRLGGCSERCCP